MMTNMAAVKPYAKAIFAVALRDQQLTQWRNTLNLLAAVAKECQEKSILNNPKVGRQQELQFFNEVSRDFPAALNLIRLLVERKKLELLPNIATSYQRLLFEHQQTLKAKIITTCELSVTQKEHLIAALQKRYQQQIFPHYQIDPQLIGGMVIYINGQTIDGSIKGMLQRLKQNLIF